MRSGSESRTQVITIRSTSDNAVPSSPGRRSCALGALSLGALSQKQSDRLLGQAARIPIGLRNYGNAQFLPQKSPIWMESDASTSRAEYIPYDIRSTQGAYRISCSQSFLGTWTQ